MIAACSSAIRASPTGSTASPRPSAAPWCWSTGACTSCPRAWAGSSRGVLAVLLVGSINYALSLGFALTFLLAGLGLAGMVHTARNLARIAISAGRAEPVFAGESAQFRLYLDGRGAFDRPSILARHVALGLAARGRRPGRRRRRSGARRAGDAARLAAARPRDARDALPARPVPRVELHRARGALPGVPAPRALAAAARSPARPWPARCTRPRRAATTSPACAATRARTRRATSPGRRWRAATSCSPSNSPATPRPSCGSMRGCFPPGLTLEQTLSRLAGWVLAADRAGAHYGLRLPGVRDRARARRRAPRRAACRRSRSTAMNT